MMDLPEAMPERIKKFYNDSIGKAHIKSLSPIPDELTLMSEQQKWILKESKLATLLLDVNVPHEAMLEEALANKHRFVKHRGIDSPGWASMALHGTAIEDTSPREALIAKGKYTEETAPDYHWTELADSCPVSKQFVESLGFNVLKRVRFMLLEPGGWITLHRDTESPGIQAWNVSINNPAGHYFCMQDAGFVPWEPGQMRGIDISRYHTVVNTGNEPRIHMIIHGQHDKKFNETIIRSYKKLYEQFNS